MFQIKPKTLRKIITLALVIVMAVIFSFMSDTFLTYRNITMLFRDASYVGIIALGVSFVVIGGGIDLSANGIVCFVGIVCARLGVIDGFPAILIIIIALAAGAFCGFLNGMIVTKFHLSEFITTLASGYIFGGLAVFLIFRENGNIVSRVISNDAFNSIGSQVPRTYIYIASIVWIVLALIVYLVQTRTRFGLHTIAMGSNEKSTMMSGVNNTFIKVMGFVLAGLFCGLAAAFQVAYQATSTLTLGNSMGFQAVAVCAIGGIMLGGGKGDALGAFLGALFMVMLMNGLYKFTSSPAWQFMFQGLIILIAIFFDSYFNRVVEKKQMLNTRKERALAREGGAI